MSRFSRLAGTARRVALPATAATIGGGALLYYSYRPRNLPGSQGAAVPPPTFGADGSFSLPKFPGVKSREEQIAELKKSTRNNEEYDILVIGAGATGAGVALDAATRGLKVAMVERDDFSSGTSSKSTKLVHGGVRYLEKAVWNLDYNQYMLVREALKERKYFLQTAPHLSSWLPIMVPLDKWWKIPYYWAGCKAYDFLAGSEGIESSYFLTRSKAIDAFPMLKQTDLVGATVYYDGAHNDSRMNVSLAMTAAIYGSTVVNHAEVTSLLKDADGKLCGATIKDRIPEFNGQSTEDFQVKAKCIINCTGPFSDAVRKMDDQDCMEIVAPASGVHVILPGYFSPAKMGMIDPSTSDGRVIFFLPWQGNTIAGTTDEPAVVTPNPLPDEKSIQWILSEVSNYLSPDIKIRRGDVLAAWSGLRPLVKDPKAKNTESLVRNHLIDVSDSGLITCAGGKWTTYRQMAEECVDEAVKQFKLTTKPFPNAPHVSGSDAVDDGAFLDGSCQTHNVRLVGAHGFSRTLFINVVQHFGVETDVAKHLTESYGDRAWVVAALCKPTDKRFPARGERISALYPYVDGEIRYAVRHEYAQTAVDVLARRTRLSFLNAQAALDALPKIIDVMSEELKWSSSRQEREWKDTVTFLQSMGLPEPMLTATRKDVEQRKLDFTNSLEWQMYSRHDKPAAIEHNPRPIGGGGARDEVCHSEMKQYWSHRRSIDNAEGRLPFQVPRLPAGGDVSSLIAQREYAGSGENSFAENAEESARRLGERLGDFDLAAREPDQEINEPNSDTATRTSHVNDAAPVEGPPYSRDILDIEVDADPPFNPDDFEELLASYFRRPLGDYNNRSTPAETIDGNSERQMLPGDQGESDLVPRVAEMSGILTDLEEEPATNPVTSDHSSHHESEIWADYSSINYWELLLLADGKAKAE
ncbi:hypothetical protein TruAng_008467 [Truncatella angustata]|nr:hypothetical protein TruAng_008467 [Truncatella angustata]